MGQGVSLWSDGNILELERVVVARQRECTKCHRTVQFKMVNLKKN